MPYRLGHRHHPEERIFGHRFRLDNLRWAPDGTLLAAGQGGTAPSQTSNVVKVNPATLKLKELIRHPDIEGFGVSTVAIQVANEL